MCPKDPNMRHLQRKEDLDEEHVRILKSNAPKNNNLDSHVVTNNMFDRMMLENASNEKMRKRLLSYDDYNYAQFNANLFAMTKEEVETEFLFRNSKKDSESSLGTDESMKDDL